jgi:hypothetical protein
LAHPGSLRVQRRVSGRGVTQVAGQRLRVGYAYRHTLVDVIVHEAVFHIYDDTGEPPAAIPRTSGIGGNPDQGLRRPRQS